MGGPPAERRRSTFILHRTCVSQAFYSVTGSVKYSTIVKTADMKKQSGRS